jgi:hypothetical protein
MRKIGLSGVSTAGVTLMALFSTNCGLYGGGGGGPTVDVDGNIEAVTPDGTGRDIVVFVYTLKNEQQDCADPQLPDDGTQSQERTLTEGETVFEVRNAKAGRLVVAFLLDNPGHDADGKIDPGDPVAVLEDPDCILEDVPNKYIVHAADVRINFTFDEVNGFPAPGRAEADSLTEAPE